MFSTENDMSTQPPSKRHASHMAQTTYSEHVAPNRLNYSDAYALASATQHLRLPALDSANLSELQTALDPHYTGFQHQEHRSQMLYDSRAVPHPALVQANATLAAKYEPSSWEMPFVHQPQPLKSYTSLTTRIDPQIYVSAHPAASYITPPDEEQPFPAITPPSPPQKRKSAHAEAEPSVARATYLRKNRNAASKCRNKQKKEQDDLVEAARNAERTNKVLKAKVAILNDDLQELMLLVEQHCHCPDSRLRLYAERIGRIAPQSTDATYQS